MLKVSNCVLNNWYERYLILLCVLLRESSMLRECWVSTGVANLVGFDVGCGTDFMISSWCCDDWSLSWRDLIDRVVDCEELDCGGNL